MYFVFVPVNITSKTFCLRLYLLIIWKVNTLFLNQLQFFKISVLDLIEKEVQLSNWQR